MVKVQDQMRTMGFVYIFKGIEHQHRGQSHWIESCEAYLTDDEVGGGGRQAYILVPKNPRLW
jgi:hypothetical protein